MEQIPKIIVEGLKFDQLAKFKKYELSKVQETYLDFTTEKLNLSEFSDPMF